MKHLCRHFGLCGGCAFQDLSQADYDTLKCGTIAAALARCGVDAPIALPLSTAPRSRRRASLRAARRDGEVVLGFNAARSHAIVDVQECFVLTPALASLLPGLRELLHTLLRDQQQAEINLTETDSGFDLSMSLPAKDLARPVHLLAQWARGRNVSRISVNGEIAVQLAAPALRIGDATVLLPPAAFLQPSREGEQLLQVAVLDMLAGARRVVDLFAGSGTFTLVLARQAKVHAVDSDKDALAALDAAARNATGLKPVTHETRDLFKRPLRLDELGRFDGAVIDPPRAGALTQAEMLAISGVDRIAYVSCNPDTFARDAAILTQQRFRLSEIRPVDQFLWSKHIELAGMFERKSNWSRRRKS